MKNALKSKRFHLILAVVIAFAISIGSSLGVNASINNQIASTSLVEKTSVTPQESDDSALASEIVFAKTVINMVKKVLSTRL